MAGPLPAGTVAWRWGLLAAVVDCVVAGSEAVPVSTCLAEVYSVAWMAGSGGRVPCLAAVATGDGLAGRLACDSLREALRRPRAGAGGRGGGGVGSAGEAAVLLCPL